LEVVPPDRPGRPRLAAQTLVAGERWL